MSGGKQFCGLATVSVGSKKGAAQPATVLRTTGGITRKIKHPSKAGRFGTTSVTQPKKQKRAT